MQEARLVSWKTEGKGEYMKPRAEIRLHEGVPRIFVNGNPQLALAFWRSEKHADGFLDDFAVLGVKIALFSTNTRYWLASGIRGSCPLALYK